MRPAVKTSEVEVDSEQLDRHIEAVNKMLLKPWEGAECERSVRIHCELDELFWLMKYFERAGWSINRNTLTHDNKTSGVKERVLGFWRPFCGGGVQE